LQNLENTPGGIHENDETCQYDWKVFEMQFQTALKTFQTYSLTVFFFTGAGDPSLELTENDCLRPLLMASLWSMS